MTYLKNINLVNMHFFEKAYFTNIQILDFKFRHALWHGFVPRSSLIRQWDEHNFPFWWDWSCLPLISVWPVEGEQLRNKQYISHLDLACTLKCYTMRATCMLEYSPVQTVCHRPYRQLRFQFKKNLHINPTEQKYMYGVWTSPEDPSKLACSV